MHDTLKYYPLYYLDRIDIISINMTSKSSVSDTKEKIIAVSLNLIKKKGYDKISTRNIARNVKISDGTLYYHFKKGKISILKEIVRRRIGKIIPTDIFLNIKENNYEEILYDFILSLIKDHREDLTFNLAYEQGLLTNKEIFKDLTSLFDKSLANITKNLKQLLILKNIEEGELFLKVKIAFDLIEAMIRRHIFLSPIFNTDEELADYLTRIIIYTIFEIKLKNNS